MKPTPPALPGAPILGHTLQFMKDRDELLQRGFDTLGPVFSLKLAGKNAVVLIGPEYQQMFFTETDKKLSMHKSYKFLAAAFGKAAITAPPEVYNAQRSILHSPFKGEKMVKSIEVMQIEIQQWLDTLDEQGEMELTGEIGTLVQNVAAHAIMGHAFRKQFGREFWELYLSLGQSLDPILPPYLPLPKFIRRDQAKNKLRAMLRPILLERRAHPEQYDDFLQDFANARYKDGTLVDNETILSLILSLMFAGHETTAGQAAWTLIELLQHPAYLATVQREIDSYLAPDQQIDAKALLSLEHLFWAVQETTRTHPSADMLWRRAEEDIDIGDYLIPKDWNLMVSASLAQRLPELFAEPEQFDPLRFAPDRKEDHQHRFALIGFGGGIHKCAGMNFANNEMMMITALLLQQFDLELLTQNPQKTNEMGASRPAKTLIRYQRKSRALAGIAQPQDLATGCPYHSLKSEL